MVTPLMHVTVADRLKAVMRGSKEAIEARARTTRAEIEPGATGEHAAGNAPCDPTVAPSGAYLRIHLHRDMCFILDVLRCAVSLPNFD
jgi:hypothetical protein